MCTRKSIECHQTLPPPCVILKAIHAGLVGFGLRGLHVLFDRYTTAVYITSKHAVNVVSLSWIAVIRQEEQGRSHTVLVGIGGQACTHGRNHMAAATLQETQWSGTVYKSNSSQ